ncbi:hypothetical protein ACFL55_02240, partial [Candidatus Latescibacterota bacterium]
MDKKEKTKIPDVAGLAELVIQTLRETKESGNRLNRQTLAQFLSRKKEIMDLLRLAWETQDRSGLERKNELTSLSDGMASGHTFSDPEHLAQQFEDEHDFQARLSLFLLNLARVPGNERFFPFIDQYRQLVAEDAALENRKLFFDRKFETHEPSGLTGEPEETPLDGKAPDSLLTVQESGSSPEAFREMLKATLLKVLDELRHILGNKSYYLIDSLAGEVRTCDTIDT